ncbi:ABC-F family ATP-binding cassette domain-containing protein [Corynebacterium meridianum]|uniref:ABC-F family ATP-binding cassette domain-containing protein n=1 Tax=Corynebacterium meridianum TaxID=2765363 RepID=A0A934M755_9CORY|nr:ABC-F family ATP-binding cassette domain-containing protein [Corynebacterium meridianum]MBI8989197.1 ABC-F family ATP-binding cassette domain-containing protein [Corynebacterium meridianum]
MSTITITSLSARYGARTLFDGLNLVIDSGHRWGLTGPNGAGKSTVLSALAGVPGAAEIRGTIRRSPHDMTVGFLHQEIQRRVESVSEFIARQTGVAAAQHDMERYAGAMAAGDDTVCDAYGDALNTWLALGGADFEERYAHVAARLGLTVDEALPMSALSGGQAARVNLAVILLSSHDVLLLDEPTNDLDLEGLEILEAFVLADHRPMMIVSHDREFLARTVTGVVELDSAQRQITVYNGGWEAFLVERERARERAREEYEEYADKVGALKDRVQAQKTWLDKGTKNAIRKSTDNDKHIRHRAGQRSEKQAGKIAQSERALDRLEEVEEPRKEWVLQMDIAAAPRSGNVVSTLNGAVVDLGDFRLGPVDLQVTYGDRILITGANGSGKSTLLGLLTDPSALGSGVRLGRIDQAREVFRGTEPLVDVFGAEEPDLGTAELRTLLAKFGLTGDHVHRACDSLSPGERTRAALALLQVRGTNLLVLDEPSNHLDLPAIEQLEQAVESFPGTVLLVTHDRRMRDTFRATRVLEVTGGQVREQH